MRPRIREDLSQVKAWTRCAQRRNSQMAVVLAVVLVSLSACVMPKTSRKDLGYTPSHPTKKGDRVERKAVPDQCLDQALGTSCRSRGRPSFRSYAGQVGGGNKGEPVVRESVRGLGRSGRVLARRGGATGEGGLNDSAARGAVGRGRGGSRPGTAVASRGFNPGVRPTLEEKVELPANLSMVLGLFKKKELFDNRTEEEEFVKDYEGRMEYCWEHGLKPIFENEKLHIKQIMRRVKARGWYHHEYDEMTGPCGFFQPLVEAENAPIPPDSYLKSAWVKLNAALATLGGEEPTALQILAAMKAMNLTYDTHTFQKCIEEAYMQGEKIIAAKLETLDFCRILGAMTYGGDDLPLDSMLDVYLNHKDNITVGMMRNYWAEEKDEEPPPEPGDEYGTEIIRGAEKLGLKKGLVTYNDLMDACCKSYHWETAVDLYSKIEAEGLRRTTRQYNYAALAAGSMGDWYKALKLLAEMQNGGLRWNTDTTSALGKIGQVMLEEFEADLVFKRVDGVGFEFDGIRPPASSYLSTCPNNFEAPGWQAESAPGSVPGINVCKVTKRPKTMDTNWRSPEKQKELEDWLEEAQRNGELAEAD